MTKIKIEPTLELVQVCDLRFIEVVDETKMSLLQAFISHRDKKLIAAMMFLTKAESGVQTLQRMVKKTQGKIARELKNLDKDTSEPARRESKHGEIPRGFQVKYKYDPHAERMTIAKAFRILGIDYKALILARDGKGNIYRKYDLEEIRLIVQNGYESCLRKATGRADPAIDEARDWVLNNLKFREHKWSV